ncbi:Golgi-associated RAB2 interactor protein 4-like [Manis javanica]|uniref:Golgi-associated RAB2 interactor protein 4-like n=1 Tax=Manis javanica TaxID=9974 RepID=UPI003C6D709C|nr:Protein FAM71C [Manis javanica]KAI5939594.1 Protein FAM71C [Manis javanica]
MGMFNTTMGPLQRQLRQGEFDIFKSVPMFESDFIQISRWGTLSDVHGCAPITTVGIANTNPFNPIPDIMLLAQPVRDCEVHVVCGQGTQEQEQGDTKTLEVTRLLPLKFIRISVHNRDKQQLRVKLATGRSYYLQLCGPPDKQEELFGHWEELIYLLRPPVEAYSSTHAVPAAPASKIGGEGTAVSASPTSTPTLQREQAGSQPRLSPGSTEAPTGRRESTQEGALRSSPPRTPTPAASCQRAGGEKIPHQPGDSTSGSLRAPREEEEGRRSSAHSRHDTTCKEVSPAHAPTAEESRASHKPGGTKSAGSWPEIHGRIGSLWHNIKARVSGLTQPQRSGHPG